MNEFSIELNLRLTCESDDDERPSRGLAVSAIKPTEMGTAVFDLFSSGAK
jgi:hypothetical protein